LETNIEEVARDNGLYDEYSEYLPNFYIIGSESFTGHLHDEFIGKIAGAKGTVIVPSEKAYGLRNNKMVHSIDKKEISTDTEIGSYIHHHKYGNGVVVKKFGKRIVVDFNHLHAGKDIECEYEIIERITDPAKQFLLLLSYIGPQECDASFENGKGIINLKAALTIIDAWSMIKLKLTLVLFESLPCLKTLEFREKYGEKIEEEILNLLEDKEYLRVYKNS
jgi:FKBP-type peptidyl-prolyl cis-trans isomerase SlyD